MKNIYIVFITSLFLVFFAPGICRCAESFADVPSLPDSLITDDYVYDYTFSDFDKAERIMQELRKRKKLPDFKLDVTEGDLYFNTGQYYWALKFNKRALDNDSVRLDDNRTMEQIHRMISCYDCLHNETKKAQYVDMLMKKAEQCGNKEMQSVAMFNMGKMLYYQGNKDKGYEYMQRAAYLMEQTDYKYKYDNLRYNYNTLLTFQELDRRNEEALRTLEALQKVVTEQTGSETPIEGLSEKEKKAMFAHYAVVLFRLGHTREAEDYYNKFLSTAQEYDRDNYLIMPYLFDRRMYDKVIAMNSAREKKLSVQGDTVTYHMTTIKRSLGQAYEEKGDYRTAARYFRELAVLRDSIKNREQKSAALELATLYETHEKDMIIQQQDSDARIRNLWLVLVASIAALLIIILCFGIRYYRKMRFKNSALVKNINDLLHYKEELYQVKNTNFALQEKVRALTDNLKSLQAPQEEPPLDIATAEETAMDEMEPGSETSAETDAETCDERYGKELYEQMEHLIISEQLYLDSSFSVDKARKLIEIPRNRFSSFMIRYAGERFPKYLNKLRLYHAARLLQENPDYSVEIVARESGIPALRSFHRLFLEEFGVTPTGYRKKSKSTDNKPFT
ncbi:MAG: helix-turn-helix domain-containing protein [Bacteroides sp.]|nr:helix-turn-helix domain-containing protein [Bacteroides sp.]